MQIDKQQILSMLQSMGHHDQASQADAQLPDQVDTDQHGGILDSLGINLGSLLGGVGGRPGGKSEGQAGESGGLGGMIGKLGL